MSALLFRKQNEWIGNPNGITKNFQKIYKILELYNIPYSWNPIYPLNILTIPISVFNLQLYWLFPAHYIFLAILLVRQFRLISVPFTLPVAQTYIMCTILAWFRYIVLCNISVEYIEYIMLFYCIQLLFSVDGWSSIVVGFLLIRIVFYSIVNLCLWCWCEICDNNE